MFHSTVSALRTAGCVFAEDEARLLIAAAQGDPVHLGHLVRQRVSGTPLEHLLGWAEFCGLRVGVDAGVFVPRRRTELLVHQAAPLMPPGAVVVDLGCGSGAIGMALNRLRHIELYCVDIDPAAVACAKRNVDPGEVLCGDLYSPLPDRLHGRVDVIVANTPYVPTEAIRLLPPEARLYEQWIALDGGADGLTVSRRVIAGAGQWLAPGGHLLMETSDLQAPDLAELMAAHGLRPREAQCEEIGATVVIGC